MHTNPKLESARAKLQSYYKLNQPKRSSLDSENFDLGLYLGEVYANTSLVELITQDNALVTSIKSLDSDRKNLVYENYSKFIGASQSIGSMRHQLQRANANLNLAKQKLNRIETESSYINSKLLDSKMNLANLFHQFTTIKQVHFILKLPQLMNKLLLGKQNLKLVQLFVITERMLKRYRHLNLFKPIELECQLTIDTLQVQLKHKVQVGLSYEELASTYQLLLMLDSSPGELYCTRYLEIVMEKLRLEDKLYPSIEQKLETLAKLGQTGWSTFVQPNSENYSLDSDLATQLESKLGHRLQGYYFEFLQAQLSEDSDKLLALFTLALHQLYRYPCLLPPLKPNLQTLNLLLPTQQLLLKLSQQRIDLKLDTVLQSLQSYLPLLAVGRGDRVDSVPDPEKLLTELVNLENRLIQQYLDLSSHLQDTLFKDSKLWQLSQAAAKVRQVLSYALEHHLQGLLEIVDQWSLSLDRAQWERILLARFLDDLAEHLIPTVVHTFHSLGIEDGTPDYSLYLERVQRLGNQVQWKGVELAKQLRFDYTFHLAHRWVQRTVEMVDSNRSQLLHQFQQIGVTLNQLERTLQLILPTPNPLDWNGGSSRDSESRSGRNSYSLPHSNTRKYSSTNALLPNPNPSGHGIQATTLLHTLSQLFHTNLVIYKPIDNAVPSVLSQLALIFVKGLEESFLFRDLDLETCYHLHVGVHALAWAFPPSLAVDTEVRWLIDSFKETCLKRTFQVDLFTKEEVEFRLGLLSKN